MSFLAQANQAVNAPSRAGEETENPFSYVITCPEEGQEVFYSINIMFPQATEVAYVPDFFDRQDYIEFKKNGVVFTPEWAFPGLSDN